MALFERGEDARTGTAQEREGFAALRQADHAAGCGGRAEAAGDARTVMRQDNISRAERKRQERKNLLEALPKLCEKDCWHIAYAVRRHSFLHKQRLLLNYDHHREVPKAELALLCRKFVIAQLRELEAQRGPFPVGAALATARKLEGRRRGIDREVSRRGRAEAAATRGTT